MIKSWFYRKTNEFFYCPMCHDSQPRVYSPYRVPCLYCGDYMKKKKTYRLRDWVERVIDALALVLLVLVPFFLYYFLLQSYHGGDIKKVVGKFLDGY